jgi:response regulator RpfG family c-di-GMP phosphodiesterase
MGNETKAAVLLVDDEAGIINSLKRSLKSLDIPIVSANDGTGGLVIVRERELSLIISDNRMPGMNGVEFLKQAMEIRPDAIRILLTGYADVETTVEAINSGAVRYYVAKPWDDDHLISRVRDSVEMYNIQKDNKKLIELTDAQNSELRELNRTLEERVAAQTESLREQNTELIRSFMETIRAFSTLMEMRHKEVGSHSQRVSSTVRKMAASLALNEKELQDVVIGAYLHDIGKVSFPDTLLAKSPDTLNNRDMEIVVRHPILGQSCVQAINGFEEIGLVIRHHHEHFDGTGYPDHLCDKQIPLGSRLIRIADAFDHKAYSGGYPSMRILNEATAYLVKEASILFDPELVKLFIDLDLARQYAQFQGTDIIVVKATALEKGMIVARDVYSTSGLFVLPKGTRLSAGVINRLIKIDRFDQLAKGISVYKEIVNEEEDNGTIQDFISRRFA